MTPTTLRPKEFEAALLKAAERTPGLHMVRYGEIASLVGQPDGSTKTVTKQSLPDFDGAMAGGCQFIIEAKVCHQSAFALSPKVLKPRQVAHMLARSALGVPCYLIIHFCERKLVRIHEPAETIALTVSSGFPFWQAFLDESKAAKTEGRPFNSPGSINREMASRIGTRVEWTAPGRARKPLPDLGALLGISPTLNDPDQRPE